MNRSTEHLALVPEAEAQAPEYRDCAGLQVAAFADPESSLPPVRSHARAGLRSPRAGARALRLLTEGERLSLRFRVQPAGRPSARIVLERADRQTGANGSDGERLAQLAALAFPGATFGGGIALEEPDEPPTRILPLPFGIDREPCVPVSDVEADGSPLRAQPLAPAPAERVMDVTAALRVLALSQGGELRLTLERRRLSRAERSTANLMGARLAMARAGADIAALSELLAVAHLTGESAFLEVHVRATAASPATLDAISLALLGSPHDPRVRHGVDLRSLWDPEADLSLLLPNARAMRAFGSSPVPVGRIETGGLVLGDGEDGRPLMISRGDRDRHLYVIGATGTGKSTFLLNLLAQDFRSGEGVLLIDPHGDLAEDARALVPEHRREDLIWADASDAGDGFRLDILAGQGGDPAVERSQAANALIRLFTRVLYAGVPEAFGPIFDAYFRNALMLLMAEPGMTLIDFERVFHDEAFRRRLVDACADDKVREFWRDIVSRVTQGEISLENMAPYITCKLAQFTGNPLVRRILCGPAEPLSLRAAMDEGRIVIVRLPKGLLGQRETELLAGLVLMQAAQAGMARAGASRSERRPVRLYVDEFQVCAGDALGELLAEARKFGLSLVLANQSLGQVDGGHGRPDTGSAALANAANLIAFRVGAPDGARLAPWFAPDVEWPDLCRQPDFEAVVRVLQDGRPAPAQLLRALLPPVAAERHSEHRDVQSPDGYQPEIVGAPDHS